jgi:hypothetical protein
MHTFYRDGFYYTSPNAAYLPPVPPFPNPRLMTLTQIEQPLWLSDKHPYLALLPVSVRFAGTILFRFGFTRASVPVEINPEHGKWALKSDLMKRWMSVENALHWLIPTLHRCNQFGMQTQIAPVASPRFSGYLNGYNDEASARIAAMASRDAFIPKFCELSWALLMHFGDATSDTPSWMATLIHDHNIHPEWVHSLRGSVFGDFRSPENRRYGAFVDPITTKWDQEIRVLEAVGVPLWFRWERHYYADCGSPLSRYCPDHSARVDAHSYNLARSQPRYVEPSLPFSRFPHDSPPSLVPFSPRPSSPVPFSPRPLSPGPGPSPRPVPPPPEEHSGQRAGESMADFFSRRKNAHERRLETETSTSREVRLQRERAHANKCPGKRARVYQWVNHDGFRIRTRVPGHDVDNVCEFYDIGYIHYNSWDNEWDICSEFGDGAVNQPLGDPNATPLWSPTSPPLSAQGMLLLTTPQMHLQTTLQVHLTPPMPLPASCKILT